MRIWWDADGIRGDLRGCAQCGAGADESSLRVRVGAPARLSHRRVSHIACLRPSHRTRALVLCFLVHACCPLVLLSFCHHPHGPPSSGLACTHVALLQAAKLSRLDGIPAGAPRSTERRRQCPRTRARFDASIAAKTRLG